MSSHPFSAGAVVAIPSPRLALAIAMAIALMVSLGMAAHVRAGHTDGTLDCGSEEIYEVDGQIPATGLGSPGPWSGLFLLEDTTKVFKAFAITGQGFPYPSVARYPLETITCTLTSEGGFGFGNGPWTLQGVFRP